MEKNRRRAQSSLAFVTLSLSLFLSTSLVPYSFPQSDFIPVFLNLHESFRHSNLMLARHPAHASCVVLFFFVLIGFSFSQEPASPGKILLAEALNIGDDDDEDGACIES